MKKMLSILAVVGLTATASTSVVSCGKKEVKSNETIRPEVQKELRDIINWDTIKIKTVSNKEFPIREDIENLINSKIENVDLAQLNIDINKTETEEIYKVVIFAKEDSKSYKGKVEFYLLYEKDEAKINISEALDLHYKDGIELTKYQNNLKELLSNIKKYLNVDELSNELEFYMNGEIIKSSTDLKEGILIVQAAWNSKELIGKYGINIKDTVPRITTANVNKDGNVIKFNLKNLTPQQVDWKVVTININGSNLLNDEYVTKISNDSCLIEIKSKDKLITKWSIINIEYNGIKIDVLNDSIYDGLDTIQTLSEVKDFIQEVQNKIQLNVINLAMEKDEDLNMLNQFIFEKVNNIISTQRDIIFNKNESIEKVNEVMNPEGTCSYIYKIRFFKANTRKRILFDKYITVNTYMKDTAESKYYGKDLDYGKLTNDENVLKIANDVLTKYYKSINNDNLEIKLFDESKEEWNQTENNLSLSVSTKVIELVAINDQNGGDVTIFKNITNLYTIEFIIKEKNNPDNVGIKQQICFEIQEEEILS